MKNIYCILFVIALFGCSDVDREIQGTDNRWIQFESESALITEAQGTYSIPILYASDTNSEGVTIQFSLEASQESGFTIVPSDGVITIPAGEFVGYIEVTTFNDDITSDDILLNFSLLENDISIGIAGEGDINTKFDLTISDDDCELNLQEFVGTYTAEEDGYCTGCYEVSVVHDTANNALILTNLYDTGGSTVIALDNSDPSNPKIDFLSFDFGAALQVNDTFGDVWATNPSAVSGNLADDISSFQTCSNYMDLWFRRCVSAGCFSGTVHIQLFKN